MATAPIDVNAILSQLTPMTNAYQAGLTAGASNITDLVSQRTALDNQTADDQTQVGQQDYTIAAAKNADALDQQARATKVATMFGTDVNNQSNLLSQYADQANQARIARRDAMETIDAKDSVNFLDDPVAWVTNQFTRSNDVQRYNAANHLLNDANQNIDSINASTQQSVITQHALAAPLTDVAADAANQQALTIAGIKANQAKIAGLDSNIAGINSVLSLDKDSVTAQYNLANIADSQQRIRMQYADMAIRQAEFKMHQTLFDQAQDDRASQQLVYQDAIKTINAGLQVTLQGQYKPLSDDEGKMILASMKTHTPLAAQYNLAYELGAKTLAAGGSPILGATPEQAYQVINNKAGVPVNLNPFEQKTAGLLNQAAMEVDAAANGKPIPGAASLVGVNLKDKNSMTMAFNRRVQELYDQSNSIIDPTSASNVNVVGDLGDLINKPNPASTTLQQLPVWQKVLAPLSSQGVVLTPNVAAAKVVDAFKSGQITSDELAGFSTLSQYATNANIESRGLSKVGIVPAYTANYALPSVSQVSSKTPVVNLNNPSDFQRYAMQALARQYSVGFSINGDTSIPNSVRGSNPNANSPSQ